MSSNKSKENRENKSKEDKSSNKEERKTLVLPVSGGSFPVQLAILCQLFDINYHPDITLGSSGGNVCSYVSLAGNWTSYGVIRISKMINSNMFVSSWMPPDFDFLPSRILGYFRGSFYDSGSGTNSFFTNFFTKQTVMRDEIWTGTVNRKLQKSQLFCNTSQEKSKLDISNFCPNISASLDPIYLSGDLYKISGACSASASIPIYVPEKIVDNVSYVDGGVMYASPLSTLKNCLGKCHIIYVSSFDTENGKAVGFDGYTDIAQVGKTTFSEMSQSLCYQDRLAGIELVKKNKPCKYKTIEKLNAEKLKEVIKKTEKYKYSMIELFPLGDICPLDLASFSGSDVISMMEQVTKDGFGARIWKR